ncbi:MAG: type I 3-dehydroquinate dehydratase [Anaerovoracaceae bacterium]
MNKEAIRVGDLDIGPSPIKICIPLWGTGDEDIFAEGQKAAALSCHLIEWRVDYLPKARYLSWEENKLRIRTLKAQTKKPILVTLRTKAEGGNAQVSQGEYLEFLRGIIQVGEEVLLDIEAFFLGDCCNTVIKEAREKGIKTLLSHHNFEKTPQLEELKNRFFAMEELGGDVLKLAAMPHAQEDVERLIAAASQVKEDGVKTPLVAISMGELGSKTRIPSAENLSALTFAATDKASAPGQISLEKMNSYICE